MEIRNLVLNNFLSFKYLNLDFAGVKSIQGLNNEDEGQETNGSGKSAIQSAIEFALFASVSRTGVTTKELIHWGEEEAYIQLELFCPIRGTSLVIERVIGKKSTLTLNENGEPLDFATVPDGNNQIIEWIGISKDDLKNYFIINKDSHSSFYTSSNKVKLEMISRFTNLSILDKTDAVIDAELDLINEEINSIQTKIIVREDRILGHTEEIASYESTDFNEMYREEKEGLLFDIKLTKDAIRTEEDKISTDKKRYAELKLELEASAELVVSFESMLSTMQVDDKLKKQYGEVQSMINDMDLPKANIRRLAQTIGSHIVDFERKIVKLETMLSGKIVCPSCDFEFLLTDDISKVKEDIEAAKFNLTEEKVILVSAETEEKEILEEINSLNEILEGVKDKIKIVETKINQVEDQIHSEKLNASKIEMIYNRVASAIETAESTITNRKSSLKYQQDQLDNLAVKSVDKKLIKSYKSKIKEAQEEIVKLEAEKLEKSELLFNITTWKFNFKQFRSELSSNILDLISVYTNKILGWMKSDLLVKWEGFKVKGDGKLSDKITPRIIRDGNKHSFGSFSGGERARLEYANILAIQYLINSTNVWGGLNFLSTDEITEGLDPLGLHNLITSLKNLDQTILLTTHVMNNVTEEDVILVVKEDGESKIQ